MTLYTSRNKPRRWIDQHRARILPILLVIAIMVVASALFVIESDRVVATPAVVGDNGRLRIWFFDIGQGDAVFIETPSGEQILIDGGPNDAVLAKLGSVMAPWDRTIDAIILTHPHADHVDGLVSVLEGYDVAAIYETGASGKTAVMRSFAQAVADEQVANTKVWRQPLVLATHEYVGKGSRLVFGEVVLDVVAPERTPPGAIPEDPNHVSIVIRLEYGETSVLFTGDAGGEDEEGIARAAGDVDVLKVGHHGSRTSTSAVFLDAVRPEAAVISVGGDNTYGHPHPVVLDRLVSRRISAYRTDQDGDILLVSDGGEPSVSPKPLPF